ncbi:GNAT family N-acetyltransferase [Sabulilitoribacter multivorans]|uniref:GNAT family N-acetyltransferase n=1 Tax=Flaviramulus multivorans TaxID=1304750 RepID=A0ABS9IK07_9FLAO|nr:GNAT family N-acetyltransferase [Flaviramulus multivorans]MCF7560915.1 GNAT family N-acetyltransferase [Flaviramulus multivorans]
MTTITRANKTQDYLLIERLADTIWREHYIPIVGKPQIDYMLEKYQSAIAIENQIADGFEYYILNYNSTSVGYLAIKQEENALFLSKIYVLSSYRGQKIGKTAIQFIETKALEYDLKNIRLTVNINNTNAIKAYEKLGFVSMGPLITDIGNGFIMDDYQMVKSMYQ